MQPTKGQKNLLKPQMKKDKSQKERQTITIKNFSVFKNRFFKKLSQKGVVDSMLNLCGGWYLETFKQVINKLNKNRSSPLPFFFPNVESMELISKNKPLLRNIFKVFDTRGYNKVDAAELYVSCLLLSKGSYEAYLKTIVDVFGFQSAGTISKDQFFYFLDAYFRAIPKILTTIGNDENEDQKIQKSPTKTGKQANQQHQLAEEKLQINWRLSDIEINRFLKQLFQENNYLQKNKIYEAMMKVSELNQFTKYIQKQGSTAAESHRSNAISKLPKNEAISPEKNKLI